MKNYHILSNKVCDVNLTNMNTKNIFWWMFFLDYILKLSQFIIGKFIIINVYVLPAVNSLLPLYLFF